MSDSDAAEMRRSATEARFEPTHWSLILPPGDRGELAAQEALEQLCRIYWPPLYAFLRKQGRSPDDAKDLTQGFFVHILSNDRLHNVHPAKGKFRNWLLACIKNYVHNEWDKEQRRGGGKVHVPIVLSNPEETVHCEPSDQNDPVRAFERQWASTLLSQVLDRLKQQCAADGRSEIFETLRPFLTDEAERGDYAPAAEKLKMNNGAVRAAATRLRQDYRKLLRVEVGRTVTSTAEINEEIQYLFSLFARP